MGKLPLPGGSAFGEILERARSGGDPSSLGTLLEQYRDWLGLLARIEITRRLQSKLDASDLVQQTLLGACGDMGSFRGSTKEELAAWLRGILAHVVANAVRHYRGSKKRDTLREVSLEESIASDMERSSVRLGSALAGDATSPSQEAARAEESLLLARAMSRLPEDYQEVIILRSIEGLPHQEVAERMGRSQPAVRMLWMRALAELRRALGDAIEP